jgi:LEA14-like dessication related protein
VAKKNTAAKSSGGIGGFFKKILFVIMLLVIIALGGFIYLMINFDSYKGKMAEKIDLKLDSVTLDPNKLTDKQTKVRLHFKVKNNLLFGVVFKNLTFDMNIGDDKVANGMQADAMVTLNPNVDTNVVIACNIDSIVARRAIAKSVEKNAGKLLKTLLSQKSVKKELGEDIKAITVIKGTVDLMIKIGSMEIPFQRKVSF